MCKDYIWVIMRNFVVNIFGCYIFKIYFTIQCYGTILNIEAKL
jgi:hypothetical protein